jgi:hypothetical protein
MITAAAPPLEAPVVAFEAVAAGERIRVTQRVKVGSKVWWTQTAGIVLHKERRRNGLHVERAKDDKAFQDLLVLRKEAGDETTVVLDEFTRLERLN